MRTTLLFCCLMTSGCRSTQAFLSQFKVELVAGFNGISAGVRIEPKPAPKPEESPVNAITQK